MTILTPTLLMPAPELLLWGAASGAIGLLVLLAAIDVIYSRTRAAVRALVYLGGCWVFVGIFSGLAALAWPTATRALFIAQVLVGPLCSALGSYWCNVWLSAQKRDRLMKASLLGMAWVCVIGAPLCFLLAPPLQLPASAALSVTTLSVSLWLSVRAAQLGDKLAWGLAAGCALTLPMEFGLYAMAFEGKRLSFPVQGLIAVTSVLSSLVMASMLWLRNFRTRRLTQEFRPERDPLTRLHSSTAMVQKIIRAQNRRAHTRGDGALMAIMVFEPERLLAQVGQAGLNDVYLQLTKRMLRQTGVVNPAGRYYDRCFIVLIETLHSPGWIRTLGLRVASSLRRPVEVQSPNGARVEVRPDIGIGIVHLSASGKDVDQLLHEVQSVAQDARLLRSRAALLDLHTHQSIPVESAELGDSWHALKAIALKRKVRQKKLLSSQGLRSR